jgi:uncharacterized protein YndB with AHSA1/START domain
MTADRVYQVHIAASADAAWAAITQPDIVKQYYYDTAIRTTWEVGSVVDFVDDEGEVLLTGTLLAYDPPRSYSHTFIALWSGEPDDQGSLAWTVEPDADGCIVTLVHAGWRDTAVGAKTPDGSLYIITALKELLEAS